MRPTLTGVCIGIIAIATMRAAAQTPLGTAFVYQGQLKSGGAPVNNAAMPMSFRLFADASGGSALVGPISGNVAVTNGLFTTSLDFGATPFSTGEQRYLEVSVNGTALAPRQLLSTTPFARFSAAPWAMSGTTISYSGGNVGIGTTSPGTSLQVAGGIRARGGAPGAGGANNNGYAFAVGGDNDSGMFSNADGQIEFDTNSVERLRVTSAGSVGIGTTTPIQSLDVNGRMNVANGVIQRGGAAITGTSDLGLYSQPDGAWIRFTNTNGQFRWHSDGGVGTTPIMLLTSGGNMGLGNSNPAARLDVSGTVRATRLEMTTEPTANYIMVSDANGLGTWQPSHVPSHIVDFATPGAADWTVPPGVYGIVVQAWGAGGGGGGGFGHWYINPGPGGGGGGGGGFARIYLPVLPGETYEVVLSAGGAGGASGQPGSPGGGCRFRKVGGLPIIIADGGAGGSGATACLCGAAGGAGGAGESTAVVHRNGNSGRTSIGLICGFSCTPGPGGDGAPALPGVLPEIAAMQVLSRSDGYTLEFQHGEFQPIGANGGSGGFGSDDVEGNPGQPGGNAYCAIMW